jgi:hypothetical protein
MTEKSKAQANGTSEYTFNTVLATAAAAPAVSSELAAVDVVPSWNAEERKFRNKKTHQERIPNIATTTRMSLCPM